jgi:hypothetical protein
MTDRSRLVTRMDNALMIVSAIGPHLFTASNKAAHEAACTTIREFAIRPLDMMIDILVTDLEVERPAPSRPWASDGYDRVAEHLKRDRAIVEAALVDQRWYSPDHHKVARANLLYALELLPHMISAIESILPEEVK